MHKLIEFCRTDRQRELITAWVENGENYNGTAKNLQISRATLRNVVKTIKEYAKRCGYDPEVGRNYDFATNDQPVSGYSTLIKYPENDPYGRVLEWVKTNRNLLDQLDSAKVAAMAIADEVEPIKLIKQRGSSTIGDQFCVVPVGDPHIGLMTWEQEVGESWDVKIAQRVYTKVFSRMYASLPQTKECIIVNTGDFFHADNIHGESSRSGHKFDLDGRHGKWLSAGIRVMRVMIDMALQKFEKVTYVNVPGNHDDILGAAIGEFAEHLYENNPRIEVMKGNNPFQYILRGRVLLGFAHGHTCKLPSLPGKMADDVPELWGKSVYRHWITGHVHHRSWMQYKEHPGASVETVGIIPPKDAYAHGGGYGARRSLVGIVFSHDGWEPMRYQERVLPTD